MTAKQMKPPSAQALLPAIQDGKALIGVVGLGYVGLPLCREFVRGGAKVLGVVGKVAEALNQKPKPVKGSRILLLGLAYKPNVDDCRESPSFELWELRVEKGAKVDYHDPHCPEVPPTREHAQFTGIKSKPLTASALKKYDGVLMSTDHSRVDYAFLVANSRLVVDTRNACAKVTRGRDKIIKA